MVGVQALQGLDAQTPTARMPSRRRKRADAPSQASVRWRCVGADDVPAEEVARVAYDLRDNSEANAPLFRARRWHRHVKLQGETARTLDSVPNRAGQIEQGVEPGDLDVGTSMSRSRSCPGSMHGRCHGPLGCAAEDMEPGDEGGRCSYESGSGSEEPTPSPPPSDMM